MEIRWECFAVSGFGGFGQRLSFFSSILLHPRRPAGPWHTSSVRIICFSAKQKESFFMEDFSVRMRALEVNFYSGETSCFSQYCNELYFNYLNIALKRELSNCAGPWVPGRAEVPLFPSPFQFLINLGRSDAGLRKGDKRMKPQVGGLVYKLFLGPVLGRYYNLRRLLAHLF